MKSLMKKLKGKTGESLIESLVAILIFTLSSILLLTTVSAASNIHAAAKEFQESNQEQIIAIQKGEEINGTAVITFSLNGVPVTSVEVDVYGGKENGPYAYFAQGIPGG